jgi:hypothetical protein
MPELFFLFGLSFSQTPHVASRIHGLKFRSSGGQRNTLFDNRCEWTSSP